MRMTPFRREHIPTVTAAWNLWVDKGFEIDERLLRQLTFEHPSWADERATLAFDQERLAGFIIARESDDQTIIDAIAVAPEYRRQGLGRSLVEPFQGRSLRVGGGPAHFLPGLPHGWTEGIEFVEALNFTAGAQAEDLHLRLGPREAEFTRCQESEKEALLGMVEREFSKRWTNDTAARFEAKDEADIVILKKGGKPIAFCHTWHHHSALLGPSTFWLRHDCPTFGGIGPVGVAQSERGQGLGLKIVVQALNSLSTLGVTEVVVDWTAIGPFYEKCGFRSWRHYTGYSRPGQAHP